MIVYPPDSNQPPEIWPKNPDQINNTISSYKATKKNEENGGKRSTYDISDYFQGRKRKIEDELVKARKRNKEAKYSTWFDELNGLSEGQLRQFAMGLENKEKIVRDHLQLLINKRNQMPAAANDRCVGSYLSLDALFHDLMSYDDLGWFNDEMSFELENNHQPVANDHNVGSLDQVQALEDNLMRQIVEWFEDPQNAQMAYGFELDDAPTGF
ncbi:hypothetical protein L6452_22691 [Arctium lappa]|uniref:Uncharacterized protein n=1 Tax=Arctium lappa TaxID=4217 RepID=A0ACB9B4U6_ARCLA|nr:hypothetical protein L6452_22691 [Arctium lappa]